MLTNTLFKVVGLRVIWGFLLCTFQHFLGFLQLTSVTSKIEA